MHANKWPVIIGAPWTMNSMTCGPFNQRWLSIIPIFRSFLTILWAAVDIFGHPPALGERIYQDSLQLLWEWLKCWPLLGVFLADSCPVLWHFRSDFSSDFAICRRSCFHVLWFCQTFVGIPPKMPKIGIWSFSVIEFLAKTNCNEFNQRFDWFNFIGPSAVLQLLKIVEISAILWRFFQ